MGNNLIPLNDNDASFIDVEGYLIIQQNLEKLLNQNLSLKILIKGLGYQEKILKTLPKLILYMLREEEGLAILKELDIDEKILTLLS